MIYLDAHVHIYGEYALTGLLDSALDNFTRQLGRDGVKEPVRCLLLLSEGTGYNRFCGLRQLVARGEGDLAGGWQVLNTSEEESLRLVRQPDHELFLLAGRQLVTRERLEVLALACLADIGDGLSLPETVDRVRALGGVAVLPWGVGKWLGKRGDVVEGFLRHASPEQLFVGDNGGRPCFWPEPKVFSQAARRNIGLLPGSDPLPLVGEESRCGSYGARLAGQCSAQLPAADLKMLLGTQGARLQPYGNRLGAIDFFRLQLGLRMRSSGGRVAAEADRG